MSKWLKSKNCEAVDLFGIKKFCSKKVKYSIFKNQKEWEYNYISKWDGSPRFTCKDHKSQLSKTKKKHRYFNFLIVQGEIPNIHWLQDDDVVLWDKESGTIRRIGTSQIFDCNGDYEALLTKIKNML